MQLSERARAKVNLYLHVTGRRADGYHDLDSLAVFPDVADVLSVGSPGGDALDLEITGPFAASLGGDDNLVLRAARALLQTADASRGAALTLEKNLPVASGIGGGSADAAAALRLLDRVWGLGLPAPQLAGIALGLGADVPVCLAGSPARMGGIGELIGVAPVLPACGIVLVNPGV
ncbi:MAG: 4-(cytidine 5'-diphospho)-2-C-methyl-D-erythritol kinase, partial [Pseudomonadota bacterium]|nr:4-(cytidine 5'-diphospho)-2-C-methyl-D-erythritol kinase [Pseudomonadota bacterium]